MAKAAKKGAKGGAVKKTGKKTKDPNAPKRAMSAFFFWMQDNRDKIKKPGKNFSQISKF